MESGKRGKVSKLNFRVELNKILFFKSNNINFNNLLAIKNPI